MTWGLRWTISPISPGTHGVPSAVTTRVSTLRQARPADPAFRTWSSGWSMTATGPISVCP